MIFKTSIVLFILSAICNASQVKYTVIKIVDGDTINVRDDNTNSILKVRLLCIDAPEKSQEKWGKLSTEQLLKLVPMNSKITLNGQKKDKYKRTLARVVNIIGIDINLKMMELGMVAWYPYQKGCTQFRSLETKAKNSKIGVWSDPSFELPWEYRRRMGIGKKGHVKTSNN